MASSWPLLCSTVSVLLLLSSASNDEQREVTFDLEALEGAESEDILQREVVPDIKHLSEIFNAHPGFNLRSFGGPPSLDYPVHFPLARPSLDNLEAICLHSDRRPRYPDSYFPASGFGQLKRMASAVNKAESWFGTCCEGNQTWPREVTLCCATKAWEVSLKSFCKESSRVKDHIHHCCLQSGNQMFDCFNNNAAEPSHYGPTEEIPVPPMRSNAKFNFNPKACQRTVMTPYSVRGQQGKEMDPSAAKKTNINFPPGKPTAESINSVCHNQAQRPVYNMKCLSGSGHELLSRQAKTVNRIEKGFKQCCKKKKNVLNCAQMKWQEELKKFCLVKKVEKLDFHCCLDHGEDNMYTCFHNISPDPHYNKTAEKVSLNKICDTHKIIKKKFPVGVPLRGFVEHCCPLKEDEISTCSAQKLDEVSKYVCSPGKASTPAVRRCCRMPEQEIPQCVSKLLMGAISKATKVLQQKRKKICPIS